MEIVGIDVGFGFTKAYNGNNSIIFKSILGDATDIQFDSTLGDDASSSKLHVTIDDKSYFIGSYAELQSNIREYTLDQEKLLDDFVKILAVAAAGLCTESTTPINVVSGLPVGYLKRDRKRFKKILKGSHEITYHYKDKEDVKRIIHIDKVYVIPQPVGSIFNLIFDEDGKLHNRELATQKLGVVDIGFKTTDLSIFDHLQYIERGSSTMDTGISKCFSIISNKLRQESNISVELYRMFKFAESGLIKIRGKEYNISNLKKRIYSHSASAIASDLNRLWENDWDIDSIILSGGGSVELCEYLTPNIEGNVIPIAKNVDARFNNVQGYCKYGKYKWGPSDTKNTKNPKAQSKEDPLKLHDEKSTGSEKSAANLEDDADNAETSPKGGLSWLRRHS